MKISSPNLQFILRGGLGYLLGAAAGVALLALLGLLGVGGWLVGWIPDDQPLVRVLAVPLVAGLFLGLAGGLAGAGGGWALAANMGLKRKRGLMWDSGIAFGVILASLGLFFLLLISLLGIYNNFSDNQFERYLLVFGLLWSFFGLLSGVLLAFLSVRGSQTWRVILAALLGFGLGGILFGLVWKYFNPTQLDANAWLGWLLLLLALLGMFFIGGGALGWTYGRLGWRARKERKAPETMLAARGQEVSVAILGILVALGFVGLLGQIVNFLQIQPVDLPAQLVSVTDGVRFSAAQEVTRDLVGESAAISGFSLVTDQVGNFHAAWAQETGEQAGVYYAACTGLECSTPMKVFQPGSDLCRRGLAGPPTDIAFAISSDDELMLVWQAGEDRIGYQTWQPGEALREFPGCIDVVAGELAADMALASALPGQFSLAIATGDGEITIYQYNPQGWSTTAIYSEQGSQPDLVADLRADLHLAYCDPQGKVTYQFVGGAAETLAGDCQTGPAVAVDGTGAPHVAWYATNLPDNNGIDRPVSALVESIRSAQGWSEPAIAATTGGAAETELVTDLTGNIQLVFTENSTNALFHAVQLAYTCDPQELNNVAQAGLQAILSGNFRPPDQPVPFCRNQFQRLIYTPNPEPTYSDGVQTPNGAFDKVSAEMQVATYEVLFTTMQYEPNTADPNPGKSLAEGVVRLYNQVRASPADYPRGMTVRILLGNYPVLSTFEWGSQIWAVLEDLRAAGLVKMIDEEIGWRVEVANYAGTYPHAHTKFLLVDGEKVTAAGFNYGYLHFPKEHPSGLGLDLFDLGLEVSGPLAQDSLAAYDMMWNGADEITCTNLAVENWRDTCIEKSGVVSHMPEVLRSYIPEGGQDHSFSLMRTDQYMEADRFIPAVLAQAQDTIDMMQVNFSLEIYCMANLVIPGLCDFSDALEYMEAIVSAVDQNDVQVRVIFETENSNGLENRVATEVLQAELERRGLADNVEMRFYNGKVHAKSTLIDDKLLMVGSMNMHYSSFGKNALAEYLVATDSPEAIAEYQRLFEEKWAQAIPFEEAGGALEK